MNIQQISLLTSYIFLTFYNIQRIDLYHKNEILYGTILGYYFGGFVSGFVHWFFDTYDDSITFMKHIHENFRLHHREPTNMINLDILYLSTQIVPITYIFFIIALSTNNQIVISSMVMTNLVGNFSQLIHGYAHQRTHENDKIRWNTKIC